MSKVVGSVTWHVTPVAFPVSSFAFVFFFRALSAAFFSTILRFFQAMNVVALTGVSFTPDVLALWTTSYRAFSISSSSDKTICKASTDERTGTASINYTNSPTVSERS